MRNPSARHGFTLVEIAIVVAIIGLLAGGIVAGRSLFRASEVRSVMSEYTRYIQAVSAFRDEYKAIPGDMLNATSFWGDDATACSDALVNDGNPGTCNGDGNGSMSNAPAGGQSGEIFQFWKQLALAGYIEGVYTGIAGPSGTQHCIPGTSCPKSRLANGAWLNSYTTLHAGSASIYALYYGNFLEIGAPTSNNAPTAKILRPEEAAMIDTKLDDGQPALGSLITRWWDDCTTSTSFSDFGGVYDLSVNTPQCTIIFLNQF